MSDNIRDMVEDNKALSDVRTAQSLPDAASSGASLMGYAAINAADDEISQLAYRYYQQRQEQGGEGSADDDWFRAEQEVRRTRGALNG